MRILYASIKYKHRYENLKKKKIIFVNFDARNIILINLFLIFYTDIMFL